MGKRKRGTVHGVVAVDKPVGPTSFDVVRAARKYFGTRKVGHTGTLDPFASGVVVVLLGDYTRLSDALMGGDKIYEAEVSFTGRTDTDDHTGTIIEPAAEAAPSHDAVAAALGAFVGEIQQVPPQYAAIKKDGEKMYERARRGEHTEVAARTVHIDEVALVSAEGRTCTLRVHCQKGTYIRAIARDLGAALAAPAHLTGLRRIKNGAFTAEASIALSALIEPDEHAPRVIPVSGPDAAGALFVYHVGEDDARRLWVGQDIAAPDAAPERVLCFSSEQPVALCERRGTRLFVSRGFPKLDEAGEN